MLILSVYGAYAILMWRMALTWDRMPDFSALSEDGRNTNLRSLSVDNTQHEEGDLTPKVTVIVPARNEAGHIAKTISCLLNQNYPKERRQFILVDDHSEDDTVSRAREAGGDALTILELAKISASDSNGPLSYSRAFKKRAIDQAVKRAEGELIVTTDADCTMESGWLRTLVSFYAMHKPEMITMPVMYRNDLSWIERFQHLEILGYVGIGAVSLQWGIPITCNGANLAYSKKAYLEVSGYGWHRRTKASGDDEELMKKIHRKFPGKVQFCKTKDVMVCTEGKSGIQGFLEQRMRWGSKTFSYKGPVEILLGSLAYVYMLICFGAGIISALFALLGRMEMAFTGLGIFVGGLLLKILADRPLLKRITGFSERRDLMRSQLPAQLFYMAYVLFLLPLALLLPYNWKGRRLR